MTNITITRSKTLLVKSLVKTAGPWLLLGCFAIPGQAVACGRRSASTPTPNGLTEVAAKAQPSTDEDFYHSADNPFFAD